MPWGPDLTSYLMTVAPGGADVSREVLPRGWGLANDQGDEEEAMGRRRGGAAQPPAGGGGAGQEGGGHWRGQLCI